MSGEGGGGSTKNDLSDDNNIVGCEARNNKLADFIDEVNRIANSISC